MRDNRGESGLSACVACMPSQCSSDQPPCALLYPAPAEAPVTLCAARRHVAPA